MSDVSPLQSTAPSPAARAGAVVVGILAVVLIVVFAVNRIVNPPQPVQTAAGTDAQGRSVVTGVDPRSGITTTFIGIGNGAGQESATGNGSTAAAGGTAVAQAGAAAAGAVSAAPGGDPSLTGASHPDDLVTARQLVMDSNETAMMAVDPATPDPNVSLQAMKDAAYQVYTNLSVAAHLFPSSTKPVTDKDGNITPSTAAAAGIWDNFDAFYGQMMDAANLAYDMSQATDVAKFQMQATMLRADCDSCHMKNMHVFDPTKAGGGH